MELELQNELFACFQAYPALTDAYEETAETIVPDYCPDVARIVDASACLLLRSRELTDGRASVSGSVKMTVLYLPEDGQGLRNIDYAIPFEHVFDARLPEHCGDAAVEGCVAGSDVRLMNPRKLFTRVQLELRLTPFCRSTLTVCTAIPEEERFHIEQQRETHELSLLCAVREKDFVIADELTLPGGREPIRELLRVCPTLRLTECKSVGGKVVLKGVAELELLYLSESGTVQCDHGELPFSQIAEGAAGDDVTAEALLRLTGSEVHTGAEAGANDARTIDVKLFASACVLLRQTQRTVCITDLYSTSHELSVRTETLVLTGAPERTVLRRNVREQIDTGTEVRSVLCASVRFSGAHAVPGDPQTALHAAAHIKVLYLDENGTPLLAERRCEVVLDTELPAFAQLTIRAVSAGDVTVSVNAAGLEVRFPAEFTVTTAVSPACVCVTAVSAEERRDAAAEAPSLVLRALRSGETLWDVAKQYRTTIPDILAANELTDGDGAAGQLLLIPRKR